MAVLRISRGLDLQGRVAYLGFVVWLTGIILLIAVFSWFSLLVFLIGIYMLFRIKSVEFDATNKRMRFITIYSFIYKLGEWRPLYDLEAIHLESSYDTERSRFLGTNLKRSYRSFPVHAKLKDGQKFLINDYGEYQKSLKLARQIAEYTDVELVNEYANLQQSALRRRRRMGYR